MESPALPGGAPKPPMNWDFIPNGQRQQDESVFAPRRLNAVEINGTSCSLQGPTGHSQWHAALPRFPIEVPTQDTGSRSGPEPSPDSAV